MSNFTHCTSQYESNLDLKSSLSHLFQFSKFKMNSISCISILCGIFVITTFPFCTSVEPSRAPVRSENPWSITNDGVLKHSTLEKHEYRPRSIPGIPRREYACPPADAILPCECLSVPALQAVMIFCNGPLVTPESITHVFLQIRLINQMDFEEYIVVENLGIQHTLLTQVNLESFYHLQVGFLDFQDNPRLARIAKAPEGLFLSSISAKYLWFTNGALTRDGFGNALGFFNPETATEFSLWDNRIENGPVGEELIPGLSNFTLLNGINLNSNRLTRIDGGQFRTHSVLSSLTFTANLIEQIADDAFVIEHLPENEDKWFGLYLDDNLLTDGTMNNAGSGVIGYTRPIAFTFRRNRFESLSAENFETLLRGNDMLDIYLEGNAVVCGEGTKWLKDGRDYYENHVMNARCANDPGNTVFTTGLI